MSQSKPAFPISRRKFTMGAAVAATAVLFPGSEAQAASPVAEQSQSEATKLSPGARAEVDMKVKEIFRKYGSRLNDEQKADIKKVMADTQDGLEKMRSFVLSNGDQPAAVFQLYREGERK